MSGLLAPPRGAATTHRERRRAAPTSRIVGIALTRSGADGNLWACAAKVQRGGRFPPRCCAAAAGAVRRSAAAAQAGGGARPRDDARQGRSAGRGRRSGGDLAGRSAARRARAGRRRRSPPRTRRSHPTCWSCRSAPPSPFPITIPSTTTSSPSPRRSPSTSASTAGARRGRCAFTRPGHRAGLLQRPRADERARGGAGRSRGTPSRRATAPSRSAGAARTVHCSTPGTSGRPK